MSKESAYLELHFRSPDSQTRICMQVFVKQLDGYASLFRFQRQ